MTTLVVEGLFRSTVWRDSENGYKFAYAQDYALGLTHDDALDNAAHRDGAAISMPLRVILHPMYEYSWSMYELQQYSPLDDKYVMIHKELTLLDMVRWLEFKEYQDPMSNMNFETCHWCRQINKSKHS